MFEITKLKIENGENVITDCGLPLFSVTAESDKRGAEVTRAVIAVGEWKKEFVPPYVRYDGEPLKPFTTYTVKVTAECAGERAEREATFKTGRMNEKWSAKWITDGAYKFKEKHTSPVPLTFKKLYELKQKPIRAEVFATALGVFELFIDGVRVGEDYFKPGFTSYKHDLQYFTYDVTELIKERGTIAAVVAGGWAVGAFNYKRRNRVYADKQMLLAEVRLTYADGSTEVLGTDESWQVSSISKYKAAEFYDGEVFDFTETKDNFHAAKAVVPKISPRISAAYGESVKAHEVLKPVSTVRAASGELIYDFGQNMAGIVRAKLKGKHGQKVVIRHAEITMDGELFVEPLRSAKARNIIILQNGENEYSPLFTYMGFRYVGVTGVSAEDIELEAVALYSDVKPNGSFECSDSRLNRLQSNIVWSTKSNFVDIPTDCPQRDERMGWTGDISIFAPTAAFNFDTSRFLNKWLNDLRSEQKKSGGVPMTIPHVVVPMQWELMITMAVDFWGDSCILVPWAEYMARGDIELLKKSYPSMKRYLKAVKFWAGLFSLGKHRRIWKLLHHYGDWCAPNIKLFGWMGRGKWTATACWANSLAIVAKIARLTGNSEDEAKFLALREEVCTAYRDIFTDKHGKLKKEFQTAYVLPLYFNMLKGEEKRAAADNLARLVKANEYKIATGFPGTPYILFALCDNGHKDEAFKMLLSDECPSWLYEVKAGATTIWERWDALREDGTCNTGATDGTNGMVSFNHYAFGAVGDFLYRRVAGIETKEGGYKRFSIAPVFDKALTYAKAEVDTPYGVIKSDWKMDGGKFKISVRVPTGTECELTLPSGKKTELKSGTYDFSEEFA